MEETDRPIQARLPRDDLAAGRLAKVFGKELATESAVPDCLGRRFCKQTTGQPVESISLSLEA